jgi:hypothetical protein
VVLGEAHHRSGNADPARMEWQAAQAGFEAFGAGGWVERVGGLIADRRAATTSVAPPPTGSPASTATFTCACGQWTVCFDGRTVLVRDLKGLRLLARLLASPVREFHVLDLVAAERGTLPVGPPDDRTGLDGDAGAGLPVIDAQAREAYRRRLADVEDDIDEAERMNDVGRLELARRDRDYLVAELTQAVGLGGRHRALGSTTERARTSVTRSLRYAIARLAEHHPTLATHLDHAVRTGTYCSYAPDPLAPVVWQLSAQT